MSSIRPFIAERADFQPELVEVMGKVFDNVCTALHVKPEQFPEREMIAESIIDLVRAGVRDPEALRDQTMDKFSLS